jgi:hypothetical protein
VYLSCLMLSVLAPSDLTAAQQRAADEQLGQMAAALMRSQRRVAARTHAITAIPGRAKPRSAVFRKSHPARRAAGRA